MTQRFEFTPSDLEPEGNVPVQDEYWEAEDWEEQDAISLKQKIILISIITGVFVILIGVIIAIMRFAGRQENDGLILDNVFAAGIELSGMTLDEATNALHLATDNTFTKKDMVIKIHDEKLTLSPEDTLASLDVDAVVQDAYQYGRSGTNAENTQIQKNAKKRSYTIPLLQYMTLDKEFIREAVNSYCERTVSTLTEPVTSVEGQRPVFDPNNPEAPVTHQVLRITLGTPDLQLDPEDLYNRILDAYSLNELLLEYEAPQMTLPSEVNARKLFDLHCSASRDASMDPNTYVVTPEEYGYAFDADILQEMIDQAHYGESLEIEFSFVIPDVTAAQLSQGLFLDTLGEYCSIAETSIAERNSNIRLSCSSIDQLVIKPGETFSFNQALKNVSQASGYQITSVSPYNADAMGGGISQTASALYYCALLANLDIVERHSHQYAVDFIELGLDAYADGSTKDLRFRNNTNSPIRIIASSENGTVTISLRGVNSLGYKTRIQTAIVSQQDAQTIYQPVTDQSYRDGEVLIRGVPGYLISVTMEKIDPSTGAILSSVPVSSTQYEKKDTVVAQVFSFTESTVEPTGPVFPTETLPASPHWP